MISRGASAVLIAILCMACGTGGRAASSSAPVAPSPVATAVIDVNDMMGAFPPATFFVLGSDGLKAIALLNHAIKYTIPLAGRDTQVAVADEAGRVYVLDQPGEGARLRWFDLDSGNERASRLISGVTVAPTGIAHGALTVDRTTGLVHALLRGSTGIAVEEFDWFTLRPSRQIVGGLQCADRLVSGGGRVAAACLKEGSLVLSGNGESVRRVAPHALAGIAIAGDGTLMGAASDGRLVRIDRATTELQIAMPVPLPKGGTLIADGVAVNAGCCFYFGISDPQANDVQSRLVANGFPVIAFPSTTVPSGGLLVQAPFAYYVIDGKARHIDINQGFQEVMAAIGGGAMAGAVAAR
ncbi:MAG TPA: hypothetical protein VM052_05140 [Candidatus Limnocylindrales bacterium]|nr:hypothetical protein [Candidatus Limnocylindrales bacterium]